MKTRIIASIALVAVAAVFFALQVHGLTSFLLLVIIIALGRAALGWSMFPGRATPRDALKRLHDGE
jgi:hypothetical protein